MIIETDLILAVASRTDRHHEEAAAVIRNVRPLRLSPYAIIELDLLMLSGRFRADAIGFHAALERMLSYYNIDVVRPSPRHAALGWELRSKYGLTYFDSLHAAVALTKGEPIVSYDAIYSKVRSLSYLRPRDALKRL